MQSCKNNQNYSNNTKKHLIIVGGGVIGITSAYYLAKAGYKVSVIEQNNDVALESSFANGSHLGYSCIYPVRYRTHLIKTTQAISNLESMPFTDLQNILDYYNKSQCKKIINTRLTDIRNHLFVNAKTEFQKIVQEIQNQYSHYQLTGILQLFFDQDSFNKAIKNIAYKHKFGCDLKVLANALECIAIDPSLANSQKKIVGGILANGDGTGDAFLFTKILAEKCKALGVEFLFNTKITELKSEGNLITSIITQYDKELTADAYIISLGNNTNNILKSLNTSLPMVPVKGYSLSIRLEDHDVVPNLGIADEHNKIFYSKLGNSFRVAGLSDPQYLDNSINPDKINQLITATEFLFPNLNLQHKIKSQMVEQISCLRPSSLLQIPFISKFKYNNLFVNTGHGGYGWTLAPISAKLITDIVVQSHTRLLS
jgi:D-amino-acid dehydrogenase